eukprot:490328-Heterocapsa_arctica.AAC.1
MLAPCFATTLGFGTPFSVFRRSGSWGSSSNATARRSFAGARTAARVVRQLHAGAPKPGPGRPAGRRAGLLEARNGYGY